MIKKISVYGLGNFGYAILKHLDKNVSKKIDIHAYDRNKNLIRNLKKYGKHLRLHKKTKVSNRIIFDQKINELLFDCDLLVLAINSDATREVLRKIKLYVKDDLIIVNTAKALDFKTGKRISTIIQKEFDKKNYSYALLAGGTTAKDLFNQEPLGADVACENIKSLKIIREIFQAPNLTIYPTTDLLGVEYASAYKNVISIMAGIIKGMKFSYGSETHMISKCAYEIQKIILELGANPKTFSMKSQSWSNDLWMSCTSNTRNREFGILLGNGNSVNQVIKIMKKEGKTIEGVNTLRGLAGNAKIKNYPLMNFLYQFIVLQTADLDELKKLIFTKQY